MNKRFKKFWSDVTLFAKKQYQARPLMIQVIGGLVALALFGWFATYLIRSTYPSMDQATTMPIMLATKTADPMRLAPSATPTYIPTITPSPIPSNLWVVNQLMGPVNGALIVEFKNTSTGETKKGKCQSPRDPAPKVGDIFVAETKVGYILLSPVVPGTTQIDFLSKTQRFIFIP